MKIYYPIELKDGHYSVYGYNLKQIKLKRILGVLKLYGLRNFFNYLKNCYLSKKRCQEYCYRKNFENTPDIDFGGILQLKF